ncbi:TlpA family protein disulfide reductase [Flavobacteriaceae bacterium F08102]|nr:TlpA family protein disulfide reductase [Flavobacteriaceae bacterium F08102]
MKKLIVLVTILSISYLYSQEKKLWAKSYLNNKAPELVVEKWLTKKPNTDGKFILIDFWATWCGPCKRAIPDLNKYHQKFSDNLVVIGLSNESKKKVKAMKIPKIAYFNAIDTKERLKQIYEVKRIPHCVLIDPNGIVVWEGWPHQNGYELTEETIGNLINTY